MSLDKVADITKVTHQDSSSIFSLISSTDTIGKIVMLLLVIASIYSIAIIIDKLISIRKTQNKIAEFESVFWSGMTLDELYIANKNNINNPFAAIFLTAMNEVKKNHSRNMTDFLKNSHKERILQSMYLVKNKELEKLLVKLPILATIASNAPFVGLLGTVWGIMHSFQSIAASKNTSLAVVAPGIAEALLATAMGLFAAIPALVFYNLLSSRIDKLENKADEFITELNFLLSRAIDSEKI